MIFLILAFLAGVLTILSPCILPILPFVFARAAGPFTKNGAPLLLGMIFAFAAFATLAATAGGWAVAANQYSRYVALVLLSLFGLSLLMPTLAQGMTRPIVELGARLTATSSDGTFVSSVVLGVATGLLWAPCAGPILGLVLTGAALRGASFATTLALVAYAAGAATSLSAALLFGGKISALARRSLAAAEWTRRTLGAAVLISAAAIASGADRGYLSQLDPVSTAGIEQALLNVLPMGVGREKPTLARATTLASPARAAAPAPSDVLPIEGNLPPLEGAIQWLNSAPLSPKQLQGKVVLIDFWTYSCINCIRTLPYLKDWSKKYRDAGLVVIGVHTPEFAFEKRLPNVQRALKDLEIDYPVAVDSNYAVWKAFNNQYWPAMYFVDVDGRIRHHMFGEGDYGRSEQVIQSLLAGRGTGKVPEGLVGAHGEGTQAAPGSTPVLTPETYLGYGQSVGFTSLHPVARDQAHEYPAVPSVRLNQWSLTGNWIVEPDKAKLLQANGRIVYRFHARDLHLVLGPSEDGRPVRFRVLLDGVEPRENHGTDIQPDGSGTADTQKLYQLIRQPGTVKDRLIEIEFLDPGAQAYAFTFG